MKIDTDAIIEMIAERAGIREDQARAHLNQLIEVIRAEAATEGEYEIDGFGTFYREDQKLQFRPSEELRSELNYQYAGMEPIEISEMDLSVSAEEEDQIEEDRIDEDETLISEPEEEELELPETEEESSEQEYTEVDDVFGLESQRTEDQNEESERRNTDEEYKKEEKADTDDEIFDEREESSFRDRDEEGSLEDEIASELYTTRESPIEDVKQLKTGIDTKLSPLGSFRWTGQDQEDTGTEPEEGQAETREPVSTADDSKRETDLESESKPTKESAEDEIDLEEGGEKQTEEDIFDLEKVEEQKEEADVFDYSEIEEDEVEEAETEDTKGQKTSGRSRRKRFIGLGRWFSRLNERFPIFPVFVISLAIVILGFAFWLVLNPELRNNMMSKVDGFLPTGGGQATVEQKQQPSSKSVKQKPVGAAEQRQKGQSDTRQNQAPSKSAVEKQPGQPSEQIDPYGMRGSWYQQGESYTLIISSFRKRSNAGDLNNRMQQQEYRTHIQRTRVNGQTFYRVAVGQFQSIDDARRGAAKLPASYQEVYFIRRISNN